MRRTRDEFRDAVLHLAGGFVGESDREDILRRDAVLDQIGDAAGDDARLARACAG